MNALKPSNMTDKPVKQTGLTLIELIIVVIIFGIVASMAAPSFARLIAENRVTANANQFLGALIFARSEAIKRNQNVILEHIGGSWQQGWRVKATDPETLIRQSQSLDEPLSLMCESDCNEVRFTGAGRSQNELTFTLCDATGVGRQIQVLLSGQSFVIKVAQACSG